MRAGPLKQQVVACLPAISLPPHPNKCFVTSSATKEQGGYFERLYYKSREIDSKHFGLIHDLRLICKVWADGLRQIVPRDFRPVKFCRRS